MAARSPANPPTPGTFSRLLSDALASPETCIAELLDAYRPLLLAIADAQVEADLRPKVSPSDLVQETIIEARRDFHQAKSETGPQLEAWLKAMLLNNLADARKRYRQTAKRDIRRERSVHDSRIQELLERVVQQEFVRKVRDDHRQKTRDRLARALKRLPREKRAIILWVHMKGRSLHEIAELVDRSYDATRMFWKRALLQLKQELEKDDVDPDAAS
jgi:RNA polymerase sigma-70 factor (ECF subfamily)